MNKLTIQPVNIKLKLPPAANERLSALVLVTIWTCNLKASAIMRELDYFGLPEIITSHLLPA
jgi:hypothetical protein